MTERTELGLQLEAGLREAIAHRKGKLALESRHVEAMPAARVREIRRSLAKSTKDFERRFGIPARTVEGWEQGRKIDVAHRVQAHPSCQGGRHVAEVACRVTVCRLVQRNREHDRNRVDRERLDKLVHGASSPSRRGSPRPTRKTTGVAPDRSTTVVGSIGQGPASMMAASTCS